MGKRGLPVCGIDMSEKYCSIAQPGFLKSIFVVKVGEIYLTTERKSYCVR